MTIFFVVPCVIKYCNIITLGSSILCSGVGLSALSRRGVKGIPKFLIMPATWRKSVVTRDLAIYFIVKRPIVCNFALTCPSELIHHFISVPSWCRARALLSPLFYLNYYATAKRLINKSLATKKIHIFIVYSSNSTSNRQNLVYFVARPAMLLFRFGGPWLTFNKVGVAMRNKLLRVMRDYPVIWEYWRQ